MAWRTFSEQTVSLNLAEAASKISSFMERFPEALTEKSVVDDLFTVEYKIQKLGHDTIALRSHIISKATKEALGLKTIKEGVQSFELPQRLCTLRSSYFFAVFNDSSYKDTAQPVFELKEDPPEAVQVLFEYLATGSTKGITGKNVFEVQAIADKYDVSWLGDVCQKKLIEEIIPTAQEALYTLTFPLAEEKTRAPFYTMGQALAILDENGKSLSTLRVDFGSANKNLILLLFLLECCPLASTLIINSTDISDEDIDLIGAKLTNLENLSLRRCSRLTNKSIHKITATLNNLSSLDIKKTNLISNETYKEEIDQLKQLPHLTKLRLPKTLHDEALLYIIEQLPDLESLDLSECWRLTDRSFSAIAKLNKLRVLVLDHCVISDSALTKIVEACRYLQTLKLLECSSLSPNSIKHIARTLPLLRVLAFTLSSDCDSRAFFKQVDEAVIEVATRLQNLEELYTSDTVTDASGRAIINLRNLSCLEMSSCRITGAFIRELALKCPLLESLDIHGCQLLDDGSIIELAKLPKLQRLYVSGEYLSRISAYKKLIESNTLRLIHLGYELEFAQLKDLTAPNKAVQIVSGSCLQILIGDQLGQIYL